MSNLDQIIGRTPGASITASVERRLQEVTNPDDFGELAALFRRKAGEETNSVFRDEWLRAADNAIARMPDSS